MNLMWKKHSQAVVSKVWRAGRVVPVLLGTARVPGAEQQVKSTTYLQYSAKVST